ncbi:hypothetical protein RUM43_006731 [Polyplax serrata]|uniref:Protein kinase domain-containing protein n=1 Tax=Polyplax serrata TaxID=468196 RepID=A0AAN8S8A6_POLSC
MVVDRSNVDHIMRGLQSTEGVRLHNHRKKLRQRFDIIKKLGQGTYGKVQLGINKETGQEVAIKTIKKCKIETEADLVRIRREIQIMSSVRHPNIIHIYEVFENREKIVLVMEYAAGGELYDYLSERKVLEETEARRIFRQISTAIYYCHKHKICHRDLKLENILLDENGNAKIADFGLSNVFDGQRLLSTYCGSPLYASPEIVKGTPYHGPEVDCWSLGVLLYTLVYGAMPFDGTNFKRLVKHISQGDYFEPKKASSASPLIRDMLTVNSKDRITIEQICSHWWVNQGFNVSCLDIAEDLANQTPVRLDLLLSLAPPPENTEKIVVTDDQRTIPQEGPPRSLSVGSFMDLDANTEERVKSFVAREVPAENSNNEKTMKRKLEPVPSKSFSGARKKERTKPDSEEKIDQVPETDKSANKIESNNTVMDVDAETGNRPEEKSLKNEISAKEETKLPEKVEAVTGKLESKSEPGKIEPEVTPEAVSKDKPTRKSVKIVKKKVVDKKDSEPKSNEVEPVGDKTKTKKKKTETPEEEPKKEVKQEQKTSEKEELEQSKREESVSTAKSIEKDERESTPKPEGLSKPVERRKSKIFETAEKFMTNDQKSPSQEKPKKVYIPGVKVSDFAKAFERKSSIPTATPLKSSPSKKAMSKESSPVERKTEPGTPEKKNEPSEVKSEEKKTIQPKINQKSEEQKVKPKVEANETADKKSEEDVQPVAINDEKLKKLKDSARNVIASALVDEERKKLKKQVLKPPVPKTKAEDLENKKKNLTLQLGKETATVQVHTPENTKFFFEPESEAQANENKENVQKPKEKKTSKLEITLKSNTLPRRTSKTELRVASPQVKPEPPNFRTEVEHRIGDPAHVYSTQRSEVAFPVSAATKPARSMSVEPEGRMKQMPVREPTRERIIPIQFEGSGQKEEIEARDRVKELDRSHETRVKHPYQRTWSLKSNSLSRQSTQDSDTESTVSTTGEPIKKSAREFIIPIAVEGGGYVTPRATSLEPSESMSSKRSHRPFSRKFSLFSDNGSEDESPFSTLQRHSSRDFDEPFRLHRLRSSRPTRPPTERGDSASGSEEEEDDDGFELLTAENLFSTLLSRVRSLTQRLNVEDGMRPGFPTSRLLSNHFGPSERLFANLHQPMTSHASITYRKSVRKVGIRICCPQHMILAWFRRANLKGLSDRSDFGRSINRDTENGSTVWPRSNVRNSDSNRSVPRGESKSKRSDSDTESLSESLSMGQSRKHKSNDEKKVKKFHHHSRTKSVPLNLKEAEGNSEYSTSTSEVNKSVYMPSRMWSAKAYDRGSVERESPSRGTGVKYRSEIPRLLRPTSLLLERRQNSQEQDGGDYKKDPSERDFYDILAEKYGITNVKRYDLPPERRDWSGYHTEKRRSSTYEKREGSICREQDKQGEDGPTKKEEGLAEKYKAPSEKLAAVLNRLEGRSEAKETAQMEKKDKIETGTSSAAHQLNEKTRMEYEKRKSKEYRMSQEEGVRSRIPRKVVSRHQSDMTLKEYNGLQEKAKKERTGNEESPEKSPITKYLLRYHSVDEGNQKRLREREKEEQDGEEKAFVKSKFLTSLERKLDRLKTAEKKYVDKAIRSLRESSLGPTDVASENALIKRAVSLSDCPSCKHSPNSKNQSTVNSVIGMFNKIENTDVKRRESGKQDGGDGGKSSISVRKNGVVPPKIELSNSIKESPRRASYFSGNNGLTIPKPTSPLTFEDPGNFLSPESESYDSWSICSDLANPDDVIGKNLSRHGVNAEDVPTESVSERIRRKSFYTRFNERKKPRRSSLLLSRSYDPELEPDVPYARSFSVNPSEPCTKPAYYRSVSSGDEKPRKSYDYPRPRPFYKSQVSEGSSGTYRRDSTDWTKNPTSYMRSGSTTPTSFVSLTLPRNYRSKSVYSPRSCQGERSLSPRPLSPSMRGESPDCFD